MRTVSLVRPVLILAAAVTAAVAPSIIVPGVSDAAPSLDTGSLDGGSLEDYGLEDLDIFGSLGDPPAIQQCNQQTKSGGQGVTETRHLLGRPGPTSFTLRYETVNQPDEIRVFYQGRQIYNTGLVGDNRNEGTGSARIVVPPGLDTSVTVRVTGPEEGTVWDYTVYCPGSN